MLSLRLFLPILLNLPLPKFPLQLLPPELNFPKVALCPYSLGLSTYLFPKDASTKVGIFSSDSSSMKVYFSRYTFLENLFLVGEVSGGDVGVFYWILGYCLGLVDGVYYDGFGFGLLLLGLIFVFVVVFILVLY